MSDAQWTTVIKPKAKLFELNLKEVFHYKDLIILFVKRDFVAYYQQTLLGPLWYIIQPLISTFIFSVVFGTIAKIPTDGIPRPLFYLAGITIWNYFSTCFTSTSDVFGTNQAIFGKVYFPRLCVPISVIISNFIKFIIQFLLFIGFLIYFIYMKADVKPNIYMLLVPVLLFQVAALGFGFGILVSSFTTKYRDLKFLIGFGIQLWMYGTPIIYPISQVPEKWKIIVLLNPMAYIVELFKYAFIGVGTLNWNYYYFTIIFTVVVLFFGLIMFNKVEKTFMDRV